MKGYYKIRNNHVFVQSVDGSTIDMIKKIMLTSNQHVHIFELHIPAISNILEVIAKSVTSRCKLTIHIPKEMKDYKTYLEHSYADINTNCHIELTGKGGVDFIKNRNSDGTIQGLLVRYTYYKRTFRVLSEHYTRSDFYDIQDYTYYYQNMYSYSYQNPT